MNTVFFDVVAAKEFIMGDISGASIKRPITVKNDGIIGISGGKLVFAYGGLWHTVTSAP